MASPAGLTPQDAAPQGTASIDLNDPLANQQQQQEAASYFPSHASLEMLLRQHWYQILIALGIGYLLCKWLLDKADEWRHKPRQLQNQDHLLTLDERMAKARKKQQAWSAISSQEDKEIREQREAERLAAKKKMDDETQQRLEKTDGRTLGSSGETNPSQQQPKKKPDEQKKKPKKNNFEEELEEDNPKKLPKLAGGEKDHYTPFATGSNEGRYQSSAGRFRRDCTKGG